MDNEIAKMIYHKCLSNMKSTLDLEELSYREQGRNDPRYKTFKKHLMANTYQMLREIFADLEDFNMIQQTEYEEDVKDGYKTTQSGGSGYQNTEKFKKWLSK